MTRRAAIPLLGVLAAAAIGCGSQGIDLDNGENATVSSGAKVFVDHCSGCHTLSAVGAEGSASNVRKKERTDGPNFNVRKEGADQVLYAVRNGGFSGAIMPENIVTGKDATDVAAFLAKYAGREVKAIPAPQVSQTTDN
jgi:mono/diheme cytochrome c family protein